ncbi:hypothetical protein ACJX0J_037020, partial [Zea mays]
MYASAIGRRIYLIQVVVSARGGGGFALPQGNNGCYSKPFRSLWPFFFFSTLILMYIRLEMEETFLHQRRDDPMNTILLILCRNSKITVLHVAMQGPLLILLKRIAPLASDANTIPKLSHLSFNKRAKWFLKEDTNETYDTHLLCLIFFYSIFFHIIQLFGNYKYMQGHHCFSLSFLLHKDITVFSLSFLLHKFPCFVEQIG